LKGARTRGLSELAVLNSGADNVCKKKEEEEEEEEEEFCSTVGQEDDADGGSGKLRLTGGGSSLQTGVSD